MNGTGRFPHFDLEMHLAKAKALGAITRILWIEEAEDLAGIENAAFAASCDLVARFLLPGQRGLEVLLTRFFPGTEVTYQIVVFCRWKEGERRVLAVLTDFSSLLRPDKPEWSPFRALAGVRSGV